LSLHRTDLPQGTLDLLILKIAALGPIHGYGIAQRLAQVTGEVVKVPQGSLYPALHRLEDRGFLKASWQEADSGREAKFYALTKAGERRLATESAGWRRLADAVSVVLELEAL
jgi:PadR family transcriptional regulator, regulatory protein PadR